MVHTADLHIGAFGSLPLSEAPIRAFKEIVDYVMESGARYLVISGDLFERPKFENYSILSQVARWFRELRDRGVFVITVPGSHDTSVRGSDLVHVLRDAGLIHLTKHEEHPDGFVLEPVELGEYVFYGVPGLRRGLEAILLNQGRVRFGNIEEVKKPTIVLAHTSVRFYGYDPSDFESRYGKIFISGDAWLRNLPDRVSYVALGHIHYPLPLSREFRLKAAYPGAPVGRDRSDLLETYELRGKGFGRRFLVVEPDEGLPRVKSLWRDFGVEVMHERVSFTSVGEVLGYVRSLSKDMSGDFKVLLVDVTNVEPDNLGRLWYEADALRNELRGRNVTLMLKPEVKSRGGTMSFDVDMRSGEDFVDSIERSAAEDLARRLGPEVDPEKVRELINLLGRRKPENVREEEFYEEMFEELMRVMKGVLGEQE